jgi:hypothetical protein
MLSRHTGGLTKLTDEQLKSLIRKIYRGELLCPFTRVDLLARGLNAVAEEGDLLFGLDEAGVRAVIAATLAERRRLQGVLMSASASRVTQ